MDDKPVPIKHNKANGDISGKGGVLGWRTLGSPAKIGNAKQAPPPETGWVSRKRSATVAISGKLFTYCKIGGRSKKAAIVRRKPNLNDLKQTHSKTITTRASAVLHGIVKWNYMPHPQLQPDDVHWSWDIGL